MHAGTPHDQGCTAIQTFEGVLCESELQLVRMFLHETDGP